MQTLGREAAKHHRVGGAYPCAGLHGHHALDRHRHVDDDPVAFFDAHGFERIGKLADFGVQLFVGDIRHLAIITLKNNGFFVLSGGTKMPVQAVPGSVEFTVGKPFVKRCIGFVECLGKGFFPTQVFTRQPGPEAFKILVGLCAQCVVSVHAGYAGVFDKCRIREENPVFNQRGFDDRRCGRAHDDLSPQL